MHPVNLKAQLIMKKLVVFVAFIALVIGCSKDKFQTKPQIKIKKYNNREIGLNAPLVVTLEITDKEGDVDDSLFVFRQRLNVNRPSASVPFRYDIPSFPDKPTAEVEVVFPYSTSLVAGLSRIEISNTNPRQYEKDTLVLKFIVKDKAGNVSDTATSDRIIVTRN